MQSTLNKCVRSAAVCSSMITFQCCRRVFCCLQEVELQHWLKAEDALEWFSEMRALLQADAESSKYMKATHLRRSLKTQIVNGTECTGAGDDI